MRHILILIVVLLSTNIAALSQGKFFIKGDIIDTGSVQKMRDASIVILYSKDSTLVDFTRTSPTGHFIINNLPQGKFLVLVSYHDYADYVDTFDLDGRTPGIDFGTIGMVRKSTLLTEVLIKGRPDAIKIKGDTTVFNARSFVIQPNARVEDLLRQFPGIQVDKDGRITAQGQVVSKVLLDGEEFFGDDPTLVTKNIRADMVDKVQLFDKKSDQAAFTGIDDGVKTKTLNVILKEDKKNGYFGKVDAGVGTNGFYQDQALYNRFQGKQKFSVYATLSNTGKVGLNWQDGQKYGTTNNLQFGDSGNIFISGGGDDLETFNGKYNGQGIPTARTGGLHYDDKWNSDKVITNDNYKIMSLNVDGTKNVLAQYNLPGHIIRTDNNQSYHNYILRQKLDATFEFKIDTTSTFKVMVDGITNNTTSNNSYTQSSADSTNATINNSIRGISSKMEQKTFDLTALYTKKFKKRGRTFSLSVGESNIQNTADGFLNSAINFYNTHATIDSVQRIDEYKTNVLTNNVINANATYSEPLSRTITLILNYGLAYNTAKADRSSFNKSSGTSYDLFVDSLSSSFRLDKSYQQVGAILNYTEKKTTINFGARLYDVYFNQIDLRHVTELTRRFINWAPQASYQYRISQLASFKFEYVGNTQQPTIDQIQPLKTNTDPLNIVIGNPNLTPSFNNNFSLKYNSYNVKWKQSISLSGVYGFVSNAIVNSVFTDYLTGKSTYTYINLANRYPVNYNVSINLSRKVKPLDFTASLNTYVYGNIIYGFSNGALSRSDANNYVFQFGASKGVVEKYDFYINAGPGYTVSRSSLQATNNNGSTFNADGGLNIYFPWRIQFSSDTRYEYTAPTASFGEPFHFTIVNASISRKFFKQQDFKLMLSVNDLLNQNAGFRRVTYANTIEQINESTIKRYFKFSVTWDFNHAIGNTKK